MDIVADEHVPGAVVNALRSNGYDVRKAHNEYGAGENDAELLQNCYRDGYVLLTNDRDFVNLGHKENHSGLIIYTDQELQPREVVRGIIHIEGAYPEDLENQVEWLEGWI